jgi:hypothetical protein
MSTSKYLILAIYRIILMSPLLIMVILVILEGRSYPVSEMLFPVALFILAVIYKK